MHAGDRPCEPTLVGSASRRWIVVVMACVLGVASVFAIDQLQGSTTVAQALITVYQPAEFDPDRQRADRFAAEQADIIESIPVAEALAERTDLLVSEAWARVQTIHDIEENLVIIRYDAPGVGPEAEAEAIAGANTTAEIYFETLKAIANDRYTEWRAMREQQIATTVDALEVFEEIDEPALRPRMEHRLVTLFDELADLEEASLRLGDPVRNFEPADVTFIARLIANPLNLALGLVIGGAFAAFGSYFLDLRRWSQDQQRVGS